MRFRIAHKLLAAFLVVGLLPTALGVLFFSRQLTDYETVNAGRLARAEALRAADRLQGRVGAIVATLEFPRRRLQLTDADQTLLQWCYERHRELLKLVVLDREMTVVTSLFRYGYLARGSRLNLDPPPSARETRISFVQWNLEPQLRISLPVRDLASDSLRGWLYAEISLKGLLSGLSTGMAGAGRFFILDSRGRVVSHPDVSQVLEGRDLSGLEPVRRLLRGEPVARAEYRSTGGEQVLGVGVAVPGLPLYIVQEIPVVKAYALSRELTHALYMVFGIAAFLLLVIALFITRAITWPLERLEQGTRRVEQGELDFELERPHQLLPDELGDLAARFNAMVEALEADKLQRSEVEQELRRLRNYLNNIIDSMPSLLVGVDADVHVTQWNMEAERRTGIPAERAVGRALTDLIPELEREMDKVREAIRERHAVSDTKVPLQGADGEPRYSDITIYPLVTNGVEGVVIRVDDVTDRVRIEEMMIQSEKMLMVGGLAAGMAHEINNPLAGILQNVQVMRNRMRDGLEQNRRVARECGVDMVDIGCYMERRGLLQMIEAVLESGERATRIVANMLDFSRKSDVGIEPLEIAPLLDRTIELAANDYDLKKRYDFRRIGIERDYADDLPPVPCDPTKIQQVVLNLLKNAAQAMAEQVDRREPQRIVVRTRRDGDWAVIEVEDNGPGMDESVRRRIFEPFFTTKAVGLGTGLGLSVSYFIVHENHGGSLTVDSEPGRGSRFTIRLPLHRGDG
ncbi:MAG TPA: sensor histidine kinase [Sedimenticola thiotaurini]|uniref:histidine kinase n=1 Tax=Sedimenticola thiotaurini TaxID=1543721 RepID=A0A831RMA4_9GAMM|nr:sensor histidine kinase [Sedimenticola thiotaurini]